MANKDSDDIILMNLISKEENRIEQTLNLIAAESHAPEKTRYAKGYCRCCFVSGQ